MIDWSAPLTVHFHWWEAAITTQRDYLTSNRVALEADAEARANVVWFATNIAQPLRTRLARVMHVDSWFREPFLNKHVGGQPESRHKLGLAIDFVCPGADLDPVFGSVYATLVQTGMVWDELLHEGPEHGGWIHLSAFRPETHNNRMIVQRLVKP